MTELEILLYGLTASGFFLAGLLIGKILGEAREASRCLRALRLNAQKGWDMEVVENEE